MQCQLKITPGEMRGSGSSWRLQMRHSAVVDASRPRARPLLSTRTIATFFRRRLGSAVQQPPMDRHIRWLVEIGLKEKK